MDLPQKIYNLFRDFRMKSQKRPFVTPKLVISIGDYQKLELEEKPIFRPVFKSDGNLYYQGMQIVRSHDLKEGEMQVVDFQ